MAVEIRQGDSLTVLRSMPERSVHCCVTSPYPWSRGEEVDVLGLICGKLNKAKPNE